MKRSLRTMVGNEAVASVAYRTNEVIAIYPIMPASPMGEWADTWAAAQEQNNSVRHNSCREDVRQS